MEEEIEKKPTVQNITKPQKSRRKPRPLKGGCQMEALGAAVPKEVLPAERTSASHSAHFLMVEFAFHHSSSPIPVPGMPSPACGTTPGAQDAVSRKAA